jgi:hypothetical protein
MPEDKKLAREQADADLLNSLNKMKELAERDHAPLDIMAVSDDGRLLGAGTNDTAQFIVFTMGTRDQMTKKEADRLAGAWREASKRFPNSQFYLQIAGYDNDPRDLWEFPEVTRYVRRFARTAGLDSEDAAMKWLESIGVGFFAACGVFGEEMRQTALRNLPPTKAQ